MPCALILATSLVFSAGPALRGRFIQQLLPLSEGVGVGVWQSAILCSGSCPNPSFPLIYCRFTQGETLRDFGCLEDSCEGAPEGGVPAGTKLVCLGGAFTRRFLQPHSHWQGSLLAHTVRQVVSS